MKVTKCSPVCIAVHRGASSVRLKRPKAEVAQLSPGCLKITCIGIFEVTASRLSPWYQYHVKDYFLISLHDISVCIFYHAYVWLLYFCKCRTQLCSCVLKACLTDGVQPLISSLLGSHEYAWQPYLSVQSQMCRLLCQWVHLSLK